MSRRRIFTFMILLRSDVPQNKFNFFIYKNTVRLFVIKYLFTVFFHTNVYQQCYAIFSSGRNECACALSIDGSTDSTISALETEREWKLNVSLLKNSRPPGQDKATRGLLKSRFVTYSKHSALPGFRPGFKTSSREAPGCFRRFNFQEFWFQRK